MLCYGQTHTPPLCLQVCLDRHFSVCCDAMRECLIGSVDACRRKGFTGGFDGEGAARFKGCALDLQKPAPCNESRLGPGFMAASSGAFTGPSQLSSGLHSRGDQLTNRQLLSWGYHCRTKEASISSQVGLCAGYNEQQAGNGIALCCFAACQMADPLRLLFLLQASLTGRVSSILQHAE